MKKSNRQKRRKKDGFGENCIFIHEIMLWMIDYSLFIYNFSQIKLKNIKKIKLMENF